MSAPDRDKDVALIATGDELVLGTATDTNSGVIARRLVEGAFEPRRFVVMGDDEDALVHELLELCPSHVAVIVTGGAGSAPAAGDTHAGRRPDGSGTHPALT